MSERRAASHHLSPWARLVIVCAVVIGGGLGALAIASFVSRTERVVTGVVRGSLDGVVLDLDDADVEIVRGGARESVALERTERFTFDHGPRVERRIDGATLRVRSRCPTTLLRSCSASYRLVVPDNVPVHVRTGSGDVRFRGYRGSIEVATDSGSVSVLAFCGFSLDVRTSRGAIDATAACAPQRLTLRSTSSAIQAVVPRGRYRVDVESTSGSRRVRGVVADDASPYTIQVLSTTGDVLVETAPS